MKPGLAVLPLEVWTDILVFPWIDRDELAEIVDEIGNRKFAEKLQFLLHDYGKQTLSSLLITYEPKEDSCKYQLRKRKIPEYQATLNSGDDEFPQTDMPQNMKFFKLLEIRHFDDQVLDLLNKIKPLFTNVQLDIRPIKSTIKVRILLVHLLPMLGGIRGIECDHKCVEFLKRHFPGTLARAKELHMLYDKSASISTYLDWLSAPQDFDVHGPRFLNIAANTNTIIALVDTLRTQFLAATAQSTFVIFINHIVNGHPHQHIDEFDIQNTATNEQLAVRKAIFETPFEADIFYVEIMRHPIGEEAKMRDWIKQRAYFEKKCRGRYFDDVEQHDQLEQVVCVTQLTIGHITKNSNISALDMDEEQQAQASGEDEAGPSTSAKKMKKS